LVVLVDAAPTAVGKLHQAKTCAIFSHKHLLPRVRFPWRSWVFRAVFFLDSSEFSDCLSGCQGQGRSSFWGGRDFFFSHRVPPHFFFNNPLFSAWIFFFPHLLLFQNKTSVFFQGLGVRSKMPRRGRGPRPYDASFVPLALAPPPFPRAPDGADRWLGLFFLFFSFFFSPFVEDILAVPTLICVISPPSCVGFPSSRCLVVAVVLRAQVVHPLEKPFLVDKTSFAPQAFFSGFPLFFSAVARVGRWS